MIAGDRCVTPESSSRQRNLQNWKASKFWDGSSQLIFRKSSNYLKVSDRRTGNKLCFYPNKVLPAGQVHPLDLISC
jgi:hypothetical protein